MSELKTWGDIVDEFRSEDSDLNITISQTYEHMMDKSQRTLDSLMDDESLRDGNIPEGLYSDYLISVAKGEQV